MKRYYFYLPLFFLIFTVFFTFHKECYSKEYTLSDVSRVEHQAIINREKIKNWHVRIYLLEEHIDPNSKDDLGLESAQGQLVGMEFYKDDDVHRQDQIYLLNDKETVLFSVFGKKWYYRFGVEFIQKEGTNSEIPLLTMIAREKNAEIQGIGTPYDIRAVGFVPVNIRFLPGKLTSFIGNPRRNNITIIDDNIGDINCYRISFSLIDHPEKNDISIWISPNHGYNPLKFELDFPNIPQKTTIDIEVNQDKKSDIWFPSTILTTILRGGSVFYKCKQKIDVISLNKKLDPNLFNEKGLNLPIGTLVLMDPEPFPDTFTWDGEKIIGLSGTVLEPVVSQHNNVIRYLMIAAGLALICAGCLFKYFELTKKNRKLSDE